MKHSAGTDAASHVGSACLSWMGTRVRPHPQLQQQQQHQARRQTQQRMRMLLQRQMDSTSGKQRNMLWEMQLRLRQQLMP